MKFYWLLSNKKEVREISWQEYRKLAERGLKAKHSSLLICDYGSELYIRKGQQGIFVAKEQLKQILEEEEA